MPNHYASILEYRNLTINGFIWLVFIRKIPLPSKTVSQLGERAVIPAKAGIQFLILFTEVLHFLGA
jgi:hypothetical protein